MRSAWNIAATGGPDCETWQALGGNDDKFELITHVVSENDVDDESAEEIPPLLADQSNLPALEYASPLEKLAERSTLRRCCCGN